MTIRASQLIKHLKKVMGENPNNPDPEIWVQVHLDNNPNFQIFGEKFSTLRMENATRSLPPVCVLHMHG